ncbi:hypothetical protein [Campylobacter concisus]
MSTFGSILLWILVLGTISFLIYKYESYFYECIDLRNDETIKKEVVLKMDWSQVFCFETLFLVFVISATIGYFAYDLTSSFAFTIFVLVIIFIIAIILTIRKNFGYGIFITQRRAIMVKLFKPTSFNIFEISNIEVRDNGIEITDVNGRNEKLDFIQNAEMIRLEILQIKSELTIEYLRDQNNPN